MKTFEERYAAWIHGHMTGSEVEAFEKELDQRPVAEIEDTPDSRLLGDLLRDHGRAPAMTNPDFFNYQIMARIAAEEPRRDEAAGATRPLFGWSFARFAWAIACVALLGWVAAKMLMPMIPGSPASPQQPSYLAQVIQAHSPDPNISATVVHSEEDNITVLWLDGMDYLPASYNLH